VESFDAYVSGRAPALLRTAYLLTGDRYLAEDLVQEVLVKAHRHWARVIRMDHPDAYLRKAMLRQYLSWRRLRRTAETVVEVIPERPADADHPERYADREALWSLLAGLPRQQRAVLVLRYYEDLPDAEISGSSAIFGHRSMALPSAVCTRSSARCRSPVSRNALRARAALRARTNSVNDGCTSIPAPSGEGL
jgi:RNA polymerase sigma-70 factor (sigma-E family)